MILVLLRRMLLVLLLRLHSKQVKQRLLLKGRLQIRQVLGLQGLRRQRLNKNRNRKKSKLRLRRSLVSLGIPILKTLSHPRLRPSLIP